MELDTDFLQNMQQLLGEEFDVYRESLQEEKLGGLRVNTLKTNKETLKDKLDFELSEVSWCDQGFYYPKEERPAKSPYYYAGLYYIQEPSAMLTVSVLNIQPGDRVLDLCAAPGGKTTQVACKLGNKGLIVSNDISASRAKALCKNIDLMGIQNAVVLNETPERLIPKFPKFFNKIIIDAPCSGEGMFRKNNQVLKSWHKDSAKEYGLIQEKILEVATELLADGGEIVYSTCTFSPIENEYNIKAFLDHHPEYTLNAISHEMLGIRHGLGHLPESDVRLAQCGRIWPHLSKGEGHFVAYLKNTKATAVSTEIFKKQDTNQHIKKEVALYEKFCEVHFFQYPTGMYFLHENSLFIVPEGMPDLSGIRVAKSGFLLGQIKSNQFIPSQSLAMGLKKEQAKHPIDFDIKDPCVMRYLKGESFEVNAKEGYCLVCVDGFPLGFGKVLNGRLINKYFKSWIIQ